MENTQLDTQRQEAAKEYARINRRLMLVDLAVGGLYVIAWLVFGWSQALANFLRGWTQNEWLLVVLFGLVFAGLYSLINLPLSYYSGFILPHKYGMSNQSLQDWISDQLKGGLLAGIFGVILLEVVYAVLRAFPETWWLVAGGIMLVFTVLLANLAPVLIAPIFYKFVPLGSEHAELADRLTRLAEKAGTRVRGVFTFDMSRRTNAANAALTGLGGTRRIILGDTLISEFSADEIETVLAHELGHHANKDIPVGILIESILTLGGLYLASIALNWGVSALSFRGPADIAALPLFMLVIGIYGLVTMPLTNWYSRWREHRADEFALRLTGKGAAYASALTRLANQNLAEADPEPWVEILLYSHPALNKRIAFARQNAAQT